MRHRTGFLLIGLALLIGAGLAQEERVPAPPEPAAIVSFLAGRAWVWPPQARVRRELELFDWVRPGAVIETEKEARLIVVFANGSRYELKGAFTATVLRDGVQTSATGVKKLSPVSVTPQFGSLVFGSGGGGKMAGIRLRNARRSVPDLIPHEGAAVRAEAAVLSFGLLPEMPEYRIEIEDDSGSDVFCAVVSGPPIALPAGTLKPGQTYYWSVRAMKTDSLPALGDGVFRTISTAQSLELDSLRSAAEKSRFMEDRLLLALFEISLDLREEADLTLRAALALDPGNAALRKLLSQREGGFVR